MRKAEARWKAGLVEAHGHDALGASRVVDEGLAVVPHRLHHGVPAHAEVPGDLGHRVAIAAHPQAGVATSSFAEQRPGGDGKRPLAPGAHLAVGVVTTPDALGPHQHHRSSAGGQVAHPGHPAAVRRGHHTTARPPDPASRRLHQLVQLAVDLQGPGQHEAVQSQERGSAPSSLVIHPVASRSRVRRKPQDL